ncbi:hypothetical protein AZE42_09287 [Rhizopogon vesiculosus]|uniref:NADP-dependent oxidoreductase domain-containing protein n=1 Tax=Rhizopogon vesiculosus TaxID=180088 RepID=A0A1J8PVP6_9AGAM|nr:hypothetical protein AZE42_09287 [Rhizopogon vesiculosus]
MKAAWDLGINTIDTANVYSNGESERLISKFLKKYNIPRHQTVIATKCYSVVANDPSIQSFTVPGIGDLPEYVNQSGLSRAAIFNAVDASLARLETPYIDLLQIHRFDPANEYSLVYREEEREMMAYCKYNGIGVIPWSPLAAGFLARPVGTETIRLNSIKGTPREKKLIGGDTTIVNRVEELAQKKNCKMSQISLAWAAAKVTSPIVGVNSIQRLRESIITGIELTAEEMVYLEEPYEPKVVRGHL